VVRPREVVSLRLSDEERAAIELAAKREGFSVSEFLRRAGLMVAHRLREASKPKPRPVWALEPPRDEVAHVTRTYRSWFEYANRGGLPATPRDYGAEAARALERVEPD
jgi:hypothetical protein